MGDHTTAAFVLSLIGGILILLDGAYFVSMSASIPLLAELQTFPPTLIDTSFVSTSLMVLGIGGLIGGILVIAGSVFIRRPGTQKSWGIAVIILSLLSLLFGGGFLIGTILGLIGGILAATNKPAAPAAAPATPAPPVAPTSPETPATPAAQ